MTSMMMLHLKGFLSLKSHNLYSSFWSKGSINPLNFTPGFKWDLDWQNQEPELMNLKSRPIVLSVEIPEKLWENPFKWEEEELAGSFYRHEVLWSQRRWFGS